MTVPFGSKYFLLILGRLIISRAEPMDFLGGDAVSCSASCQLTAPTDITYNVPRSGESPERTRLTSLTAFASFCPGSESRITAWLGFGNSKYKDFSFIVRRHFIFDVS